MENDTQSNAFIRHKFPLKEYKRDKVKGEKHSCILVLDIPCVIDFIITKISGTLPAVYCAVKCEV